MTPQQCVNINDLRELARSRLPSFIFDMIEGGVDGESGVARNVAGFDDFLICPFVLRDTADRSQASTLLGQTYSSRLGISATGPASLYRRDADQVLARVAAERNVPFILSGASSSKMEQIAHLGAGNCWYQLYPALDREVSLDLIRRAEAAGYGTLVVTVDTPVVPKRERHRRSGVTTPIRFDPSMIGRLMREALRHPAWFLEYLRHGGMPMLENWRRYAPAGANANEVFQYFFEQTPSIQTWKDIDTFRRAWPGKLVVKGISHPKDAVAAIDLGVDAITISNHGGKVIDRAPAPVDLIEPVRVAVGPDAIVMMDGGVRRGSDIFIALALGANFVFTGRSTLYGAAGAGLAGARRALAILIEELDLVMATAGCASLDEIRDAAVIRSDLIRSELTAPQSEPA